MIKSISTKMGSKLQCGERNALLRPSDKPRRLGTDVSTGDVERPWIHGRVSPALRKSVVHKLVRDSGGSLSLLTEIHPRSVSAFIKKGEKQKRPERWL